MDKLKELLQALERYKNVMDRADKLIEEQDAIIKDLLKIIELNDRMKDLEIKKLLQPSLN
jgi:hypothetical protein